MNDHHEWMVGHADECGSKRYKRTMVEESAGYECLECGARFVYLRTGDTVVLPRERKAS